MAVRARAHVSGTSPSASELICCKPAASLSRSDAAVLADCTAHGCTSRAPGGVRSNACAISTARRVPSARVEGSTRWEPTSRGAAISERPVGESVRPHGAVEHKLAIPSG
jgi:hypothetical protein